MEQTTAKQCCPPFDPAPWEDRELVWENKLFVQDRVICFFNIPLNFGKIITKNMLLMDQKGAFDNEYLCLFEHNGPFAGTLHIAAGKEAEGLKYAHLSGTYFSKVFEGPYSKIGQWVKQMEKEVKTPPNTVGKMLFYYPTCPSCAKKYGKNYVVILKKIK